MELPVELPAAISAEESSGSGRPSVKIYKGETKMIRFSVGLIKRYHR